jgi:hypothetical protein
MKGSTIIMSVVCMMLKLLSHHNEDIIQRYSHTCVCEAFCLLGYNAVESGEA